MRRFVLGILTVIQSCVVFMAMVALCSAQEGSTDASAVALNLRTMKVGDIGHLATRLYRMTIAQVFENKILVNYAWHLSDRFPDRSGTFFVKGIDTKGLVSDARWEPSRDEIFEVTGTETYETVAGGTKTVFVLSKMHRREEQALQKAPDPFADLPEEVAKYARARQADEAYLLKRLRESQDAVAETSGA